MVVLGMYEIKNEKAGLPRRAGFFLFEILIQKENNYSNFPILFILNFTVPFSTLMLNPNTPTSNK